MQSFVGTEKTGGEKRRKNKRKGGQKRSMHGFRKTNDKSDLRGAKNRLPFLRTPPCLDSVKNRGDGSGKETEGAGNGVRGSLRRPKPRPSAQVIPTFRSCMHQPGFGAHNSRPNLAVHLPICTARIREIYLPFNLSPILHLVKPFAAADL